MTATAAGDVERFGELVARGLGLRMSDRPDGLLSAVLDSRAERCGRTTGRYLDWLAAGPADGELGGLAGSLTVPETYFFRDPAQLRAFVDVAVPDRLRALGGGRELRVLSAGCASGEEPYTLSMLLLEAAVGDFSILGVDVNPEVIASAVRGLYSDWALRATPAGSRRRWFRPDGPDSVLAEEVRAPVRLETHNLAGADAALWQPGTYDVIFCRNVLMYFIPERADALAARLVEALAPGGFLFVGAAENVYARRPGLQLRHAAGCFYFQRDDAPPVAGRRPVRAPATTRTRPAVEPRPSRPAPAPPPVPSAGPGRALDLLRSERFADALDVVLALPDGIRAAPPTLVLEAVLRAAGGDFAGGERICGTLLDLDGHDADAHHVIATCREGVADPDGAELALGRAVDLDPAFAIPRMHLGLLAARRGDRSAARRELTQALALLPRESPVRLLLFGGGFTVSGLAALCRSHLSASGGARDRER
jgi:chemotaxis protein methyltransferase CheR